MGVGLSAVGCRLSPTHWIFRSLMLPYKSSSHSAKCVRCASLRSGGAADWRSGPRWSILSVLCPVHPFPLRGTSPQGETRDMREKTASHILHAPFRLFPSLVAVTTTLLGGEACHMTQKVNPVTLALYSLPDRAIHNPRPERPSNLRTLRPERAGQS